jgi:hypothetical protein
MIHGFVDDEDGYLGCGYVLNCGRNPRAAYLVVHRANPLTATPAGRLLAS